MEGAAPCLSPLRILGGGSTPGVTQRFSVRSSESLGEVDDNAPADTERETHWIGGQGIFS